MDINCTHKCFYQHDGKCTLKELPTYIQNIQTSTEVDCPYFSHATSTTVVRND